MSEVQQPLQALVFGASGITGWAIARAALSYPTKDTFSRVSHLPNDPRLSLQHGIDLSQDVNSIVKGLKKVGGVEKSTHVYFTAYVHLGWGANGATERSKENVAFVVNAVEAVEQVCPEMRFFTFCTGGKWYGFEYGEKLSPLPVPLKENTPRIPSTYGDNIFYYPQIDALRELSENKKWDFVDVRPDAIVGFVTNNNPMNIPQPIALFLSLWKSVNPSLPVPFPGTKSSYTNLHTNGSQDQIARFQNYASLHPESTAGESFNIADMDEPNN